MICPYCKADMTPVNHNDRGWRCVACWAKVSGPESSFEAEAPEAAPEVEEKPKRGRPAKQATLREKL